MSQTLVEYIPRRSFISGAIHHLFGEWQSQALTIMVMVITNSVGIEQCTYSSVIGAGTLHAAGNDLLGHQLQYRGETLGILTIDIHALIPKHFGCTK